MYYILYLYYDYYNYFNFYRVECIVIFEKEDSYNLKNFF